VAFSLAAGASKLWKAVKKRPLTLSRLQEFENQRFAVNDQVDGEYKANPIWRETLQAVPIPESLDSVWVDITQAVVKIKTPVLILHGTDDKVVPLKQSEKLHALLPGMKKLCLIEDSGHALHLDQKKDDVYILIARWIKHYRNP
jgi:pimeloyl-ACP methyl ester carboxylesterase